ncbi:hypothetical protein [Bowmanella dokdonensis]|uniref:Uncharacterized protein n=1 Tax=Bowmanella dokdonensis TaxID=751969 RepID=A0A939DRK4_9ALTE|nr:hypothetical protein [Bowmanella dokdonensis]MBN7827378.1 hypothetical protein [Bowmanella dokdonensis]
MINKQVLGTSLAWTISCVINAGLVALSLWVITFDGTLWRVMGGAFLIAYLYFFFSNPSLLCRRLLATVVTVKISIWLGLLEALSALVTGELLVVVRKLSALLETVVADNSWFLPVFFGLLVASIFEMAIVNGVLSDKGLLSLFSRKKLAVTPTQSHSWKYNPSAQDKEGATCISFSLTLRLKNLSQHQSQAIVTDDIDFQSSFSGVFSHNNVTYSVTPRIGSGVQQNLTLAAGAEGDVDVIIYVQSPRLQRFLRYWRPTSFTLYFVLRDSLGYSHRIAKKCSTAQ